MLDLGLGATSVAVRDAARHLPPAPAPTNYVFAANSLSQPINGFFSPSASQLNETVDQYLPPIPNGAWVVFANFALSTAGSAGNNSATAREQYPGNANTIDWAVSFTGANGTGARADCLFAGNSASAVIASDGFACLWVPPMPAGGWLRYSITTPSGGKRPQSRNPSFAAIGNGLGDVRRWKAAASATEKNGGAIAGTVIFGRGGYGGVLHLLVPWTGQASILMLADSIGAQADQTDYFASAAEHGVVGFIPRGLHSNTGAQLAVGNFTSHGSTTLDVMNTASGYFYVRKAIIDYARDTLNGGRRWPFTAIWSELGRNDLAAAELGLAAPSDAVMVAAFQARMQAWWALLGARYPGVPIIQNTIPPKSSSSNGWTSLAGQTLREVGNTLDLVNAWLLSKPSPLALVVDSGAAFREADDGSGIPKVKLTPMATAGGGTVTTAVTTATSMTNTGIQITASVAPQLGEWLVIEPGTANAETILVRAIVANAANSWTVYGQGAGNGASQNFAKAHAAGVAVSSANTDDGLHPAPSMHMGPMKAAVIAAKGNGPLVNWAAVA